MHRNGEYALNRAKEYDLWQAQPNLQEQSRGLRFEKQKRRLEALRDNGRMSQREYEQRISLISQVQENAMMVDNGALVSAWRQIGDFFGRGAN